MLNEKLDMTQKLGDAFLGQQKEVMAAIQGLRAKADKAGNLKSSKEQTVTTTQESGQTVIKIEPADPQVVYVPTYNPAVVYGPWPYAAYPPYYYYPPGYAAGGALFAFTVGVAVGNAMWGNCGWHGGGVYINHNTYNNFNKTKYQMATGMESQRGTSQGRAVPRSGQPAEIRRRPAAGVDSREQFRGRADEGRKDIARGDADRFQAGCRTGRPCGDATLTRSPSAGTSDRGAGAGTGISDRSCRRRRPGQHATGVVLTVSAAAGRRVTAAAAAHPAASAASSSRASSGARAGGGGGGGREKATGDHDDTA